MYCTHNSHACTKTQQQHATILKRSVSSLWQWSTLIKLQNNVQVVSSLKYTGKGCLKEPGIPKCGYWIGCMLLAFLVWLGYQLDYKNHFMQNTNNGKNRTDTNALCENMV